MSVCIVPVLYRFHEGDCGWRVERNYAPWLDHFVSKEVIDYAEIFHSLIATCRGYILPSQRFEVLRFS